MKTVLTALALVCAAPALAQSNAQPQPASPASAPQQPQQNRSAAAGATAPAREDPAAARRLFRELDRNGDGYLSSDELWSARGRQGNWAAVDRNRDGRISPDEFTTLPSAR